jgi:GNAT superfamily N-acetyltransferase
MSDARERAIAWRHGQHALVCDRIEPWAHGTLVRAFDIPTFYDYNLVRLEGPDPGLDAEALAAAAEPPLRDLAHRRIEVHDEEAGARLRPGFERLGWVNERLAWLHRTGPPPEAAPPAGTELRVEGFEASRPLRDAWRGESVYQDGLEFDPVEEGVAARRGTRAVLGLDGGEPAGFAAFSTARDAAEIDLVFCLPERRGRGLGAALVARALAEAEAAGAREAFIVADDEGDSKRLYERLGFRTVWRQHMFTRMPRR